MTTDKIEIMEHKLYKRRWIILLLFMIYAINGAAQWLQFAIIDNLVVKYYEGITSTDVEWTTTVPMMAYMLLIFPSLYLLDKMGVRNMMIIGAAGITVGTWLKVFSVHRDRFFVALLGQSVQAVFQVLTFGLSARFTAIWFGADEISIAGALGLFGDQLGTALSFFIPSIFVSDGSPEIIGQGLRRMHWYLSGISTAILLLIILFFKSAPQLPPSAAQAKQRQSEKQSVFQAIKSIMKKRSFILISLSYSLLLGSFGAMSALLNQTVLSNFPGHTVDAGNIGFVFMLSGMFSSIVVGKILDKTRKFKESAVLLTIGASVAFMAFTWALKSGNIFNLYIVAFFMGCSAQSYYGTGFQMAIEVTFPVSEEVSSAVLLLFVQFTSFLMIVAYGYSIKKFGDLSSNVGLTVIISISALCAFLIPSNLKRQQVEKSAHDKVDGKELVDLISSKTVN